MFEGLNYVELSGEKYPIKCDLLVLEAIQEKFGSIDKFEDGIMPWEPKLDKNGEPVMKDGEKVMQGKIPDMKALNEGLYLMAKEGEAIRAEEVGEAPKDIIREKIARKVDMSPRILAQLLHDEFYRCFYIKNGKTTQNQKMPKTEGK